MNLRLFLKENKLGTARFAADIEVSLAALYRYMDSQRIPRPVVLERIARVTHGRVQPNDFFPFATPCQCALAAPAGRPSDNPASP